MLAREIGRESFEKTFAEIGSLLTPYFELDDTTSEFEIGRGRQPVLVLLRNGCQLTRFSVFALPFSTRFPKVRSEYRLRANRST